MFAKILAHGLSRHGLSRHGLSQHGSRRPRLQARTAALVFVALAALVAASGTLASDGASNWRTIGNDAADTRNQPFEHEISTANVSRLQQRWAATTAGDVSGTPAVVDGAVYFGDFGGMLWKLNADTGAVIWSHSVSDYTGLAGDYARTSPSLDGNVLVVGDIKHPDLLGVDATTGALKWLTQVHPNPLGVMTGSPVLVGDTIITGVSANGASGPGATFRGAIVAVDALTGHILWRSYSLPDNDGKPGGYAGATMFAPPAVDVADGLVFGTFGQTYVEPADVTACNALAANGFSESCEQPGAYFKSIVAFDLQTGAPKWSYRVIGHAPWLHACESPPPGVTWCPPESDAEKWDLGGSGPNVFQLGSGADARNVVGLGEKGGVYLLLDAKTGAFIWNTVVGTGGDQGGFEWGTAYDGTRIYVSITNQHHLPYNLTENGVVTATTVTGGSWAALDPATGKILWQTADPQTETLAGAQSPVGVWDLAPVTSANGVVYTASMAKTGNQMYALDAATGAILWRFSAGSSVNAAPAVVDGSVYWGSGYARSGVEGSGNNKLYAFSIDGVVDRTPPTTTISLTPATPSGSNGWYKGPVGVTVSATDDAGGSGVFATRCALDPATPPASPSALPAGCSLTSLTSVGGDGTHTVYAASQDNANNLEGAVVSRSFKIDATAPTITAAATGSPNPNGWYTSNVVVHFTCADAGSGIPAGACPADQTLTSIGAAVSSLPETVTDAAGNTSAPSNVITVKIVKTDALCNLTQGLVQGSSKYQSAKRAQRMVANALVDLGCSFLDSIGVRSHSFRTSVLAGIYDEVVHVLAQQGWLTRVQASTLDTLAEGL